MDSDVLQFFTGSAVVFWVVLLLICFFWGCCASTARGGGKGFWWGFALGPFGVIVAAVKGIGDKMDDLISATRLAPAAAPKANGGKITVRSRHSEATARPRQESAACPNCGKPVALPDAPGTYACPHCNTAVAFE